MSLTNKSLSNSLNDLNNWFGDPNSSEFSLPNSCWVLYSGTVHVTNDKSILINPQNANNHITDNFGGQAKVDLIGDVFLKLSNNLIIELSKVHYVPNSNFNMVSQYLLGQKFIYSLDSKKGDIIIKQKNKTAEINFVKVIGRNNVILTKEPSIESILEHLITQSNESLNTSIADDEKIHQKDTDKNNDERETISKLTSFIEVESSNAHQIDQFKFKSFQPTSFFPSDQNQDDNNDNQNNKFLNELNSKKEELDFIETRLSNSLTGRLVKNVEELLNELNSENVYKIVGRFLKLEINTVEELEKIVDLIFDKAINELENTKKYALLCSNLLSLSVKNDKDDSEKVHFHKLLTERCDKIFNEIGNYDINQKIEERTKEIEQCSNPYQKQLLINGFFKDKISVRRCWLGNIKLIGALYSVSNYLTDEMIDLCISQLIDNSDDEDSLECLCNLLKLIGFKYAEKNKGNKLKLYQYLDTLDGLLMKDRIPSRIKILIVMVLRETSPIFPEKKFKSLNSDSSLPNINQNSSNIEKNEILIKQTDEQLVELMKDCIKASTDLKNDSSHCLERKKFTSEIKKIPKNQLKNKIDLQLKIIYAAVKINCDLGPQKDYLAELFICFYTQKIVEKKSFLKWYADKNQTFSGNAIAIDSMKHFIKRLQENKITDQSI